MTEKPFSDRDIKNWDRRLKDQAKAHWENYVKRRINLSVAQNDEPMRLCGEYLYVENVENKDSCLAQIKLNKNTNDALNLQLGVVIKTVFTQVFITNEAIEGGWMDVVYGINFEYLKDLVELSGYDWGPWEQCGVEAVTLTTAGTITETSDEIDLDLKAACEVSIEATYSNHAMVTGGLEVYILGECNGTYEVQADVPLGFEMVFTQNDTRRTRFNVDPKEFGSCKIHFDWNNTTAGSNVTITCRYRTAVVKKR